ncbi:MAG: hypothetical protein ACYSR5_05485, partial [Planctomycetota bacterium]|jgi:hypothetical protein
MFPLQRGIHLPVKIVPDYQDPYYVSDSSKLRAADADADGAVDSVWAELSNITSGKGRTIYAAVRVIDNGAMLNVNTAHKFDPTEVPLLPDRIDGSSQTQINLADLSQRGVTNGTLAEAADKLRLIYHYTSRMLCGAITSQVAFTRLLIFPMSWNYETGSYSIRGIHTHE